MSKKRTKYTSTFKTKLVLELLQNKSTLVQIASKHNILPSTVTLPTSAVKRSFCFCDLISSSLYSLTALDGAYLIANS
jgi:hypothetical protein